jgi:TRAP-type C4-dicarboxylate transport system permease small subunit
MTVATLTWPQASIYVALIASAGLVVAVLIWSLFRTGQTAIRVDSRQQESLERLRRDVEELRARVESGGN